MLEVHGNVLWLKLNSQPHSNLGVKNLNEAEKENNMMLDAGKGSRARPISVDQKTFDSNWDAIFGNKNKEQQIIDEVSKLIADETLDDTELGENNGC